MTGLNEKNGVLHVDDVSLTRIADEAGTPAYIYSAAHIKSQYQRLSDALKKAIPADRQPLLCYACKANSNLAVLALLRSLGCGLEIVSQGELQRGLSAGFDPNVIVSTGVGKSDSEIRALLGANIHQINVESLPELERINDIATEIGASADVVLRLNPNVSGGGHHKISTGREHDKFGISEDKVFEGYAMAEEMEGVNIVGLSIHIGSQVFTVESFEPAFKKLASVVEALRNDGYEVSRLDIGGGFPIQYDNENLLDLDAYAKWVNEIIVPLDTEIIMEPGRYLVGNAGALLSRVEYVKEGTSRKFLVIDAAMNDLLRPALYDAYHGIEPVQNRDAGVQTYDIVGPICETGDTFSQDRELPSMSQGDLLVLKSAGAYGYCMASNYNTRGRPPEILVSGDSYEVIRPRESVEDILEKETIPGWLRT
ncbi:MAG: diaminopimelate decarboxylase [Alphaproteobacteria bacterium]|nr:diaminopimelate decarboxylase [Alphaproteobacteria bacterium]